MPNKSVAITRRTAQWEIEGERERESEWMKWGQRAKGEKINIVWAIEQM